jgi:hypothetical protein
MPEYRVEWSIDVTAEDTLGAANIAWEVMHDSSAIATIFGVIDEHERVTSVDLANNDVGAAIWAPSSSSIADLAEHMHGEGWDISEILVMIRRPDKYADEYSKMIMDREFDKVAHVPEEEDTDASSDEERELMT